MKKAVSFILFIVMITAVFAGAGVSAAKTPGDCNGDGFIDNKDVVMLFRFVSGAGSGAAEENCDYNEDGETNNKDVTALFRSVTSGDVPVYLKVMQFNVQTENGNAAPFTVRAEMYRKLVQELKPDVVGMQEVTVTWRKWLDSTVFKDLYESVGEARSTIASEGLEANPIYYRKDKFELVDGGTFWLSDTPEAVGSKTTAEADGVKYTANYPRICTWALLKDKTTGMQFVHLNTHLDHNGDNSSTGGNAIRKQQMGVIIKFAQRFNDIPVFLTGDLNNRRTTGEGKTYALIKYIQGDSQFKDADGNKYSLSLRDARLNAPETVDENHTATMTKNYDKTNSSYDPTREPIDYVFYDPAAAEPLSYETFLISENNQWISDHLPVFTVFRLKTAE